MIVDARSGETAEKSRQGGLAWLVAEEGDWARAGKMPFWVPWLKDTAPLGEKETETKTGIGRRRSSRLKCAGLGWARVVAAAFLWRPVARKRLSPTYPRPHAPAPLGVPDLRTLCAVRTTVGSAFRIAVVTD